MAILSSPVPIDLGQYLRTLYPILDDPSVALCLARPNRNGNGYVQLPFTKSTYIEILSKPSSWYVCVSYISKPTAAEIDERVKNKESVYKRREVDCKYASVVVLDDVGTKGEKLDLTPTAILETSLDNYQYVYRVHPYALSKGDNRTRFTALLDELTKRGYGDRACRDVARLYRIPGSVNEKHGRNNFETRLVEWNPEIVYSVDGLVERFNVEIPYKVTRYEHAFERFLEHAEDAVLQWLIDTNQVTSQTDKTWVEIRCPWSEHHSVTEQAKNLKAQYVPVGRGDQKLKRGFKCFHTSCQDKRTEHFLEWVASRGGPQAAANYFTDITQGRVNAVAQRMELKERNILMTRYLLPPFTRNDLIDKNVTSNGNLSAKQHITANNILQLLSRFNIRVAFNLMTVQTECSFTDPQRNTLMPDARHVKNIIYDVTETIGMNVKSRIDEILLLCAMENRYHPMAEWVLSGDAWDGRSRLPDLIRTVKVEGEKSLWGIYLRKWLIQCVQAVFGWANPKQMEYVLTFAGAQDLGKTEWFKSLVPDEFFLTGKSLALNNPMAAKDTKMEIARAGIVELGELEATFKKSEMGALKAFLSRAHEDYRPPYGREVIKTPRTTSFCASVNHMDFLNDPTGNRRFWVVHALKIDSRHGIDMHQLWKEIYELWKTGETWHLPKDYRSLSEKSIEQFRFIGMAEETVMNYLERCDKSLPTKPMTVTEIANFLGIQDSPINRSSIRATLNKELHYVKSKIGNKQRCWMMPQEAVTAKTSLAKELL